MRSWVKGSLITIATLIIFILLMGVVFRIITSIMDTILYPPVGELVDIGGYRLHMNCSGTGRPLVVLDSGLGGNSLDWSLVQPKIGEFTQVCSYDRAGLGWSDPGPKPRTSRQAAEELHALLVKSGMEGPYVLVGQSLGGINVRMFASQYPDDVAGLVLVDASHENQLDELPSAPQAGWYDETKDWLRDQLMWGYPAMGLSRIFVPYFLGSYISAFPQAIQDEYWAITTNPKNVAAGNDEKDAFDASTDQMREARTSLGGKPVIVLTAGSIYQGDNAAVKAHAEAEKEEWLILQKDLSGLSTKGKQVVVPTSGHMIQWDAPDAVVSAVKEVVDEVRKPIPAVPGSGHTDAVRSRPVLQHP